MVSASASVDIWIGAGSAIETEEEQGSAHFLEHMIFRGTEFDYLIESQGGVSNAATSLDYTHFSFTVPAEGLATTLPYLAHMLSQPRFDPEDFEQEKLVVLEEINYCYDDPEWVCHQLLQQTAYNAHNYGRSVLGAYPVVAKLTLADLQKFHRRHYTPANMTIACTGAIDIALVRSLVAENFLQLPYHPPLQAGIIFPKANRCVKYLPQLHHARLLMGWLGTSAERWEDGLGLDLIATLLWGGRSSRLVHELREDYQWVQDLDGGFALQKYPGLFTISATLEPEYVERTESHILRTLSHMARGKISPQELAKAKRSLCNSFIFAMECPARLASFLGYHTMLGCHDLCNHWTTVYNEVVMSMEIADLQYLAQRYLSPDRLTVITCLPHP
jgi:predicted Zn-dependent peptidase